MEKEIFYPPDRPIMVYEARRPNSSRMDDPDGIPAEPINVELRIFDGTNFVLVEIDGDTVTSLGNGYITMTPMDEESGNGALIFITVPEVVTAFPGNYTLYISTEYADGLKLTENHKIAISEFN